jgi:thioredoxin 1
MIKEVNAEEFKAEDMSGLVLTDFYSSTCGPCKMMAFVLRDVDKELGDQVKILKVNFDENRDFVAEKGVTGYPTLVLYKDGEELQRLGGLQQKPVVLNMIKKNL